MLMLSAGQVTLEITCNEW